MDTQVRNGSFDVVVLAGPRIPFWPTPGVKKLSLTCAEMGLSVGLFGGDSVRVKGVVPLPATGGLVLIEDTQNRIHRIRARSIIKVTLPSEFPDPFPGSFSSGLIPLSTAIRLLEDSQVSWDPLTLILGSGNRALRFGSTLLKKGIKKVVCVESHPHWKAKRFAGWEVEQRRFESYGGKLLEANPLELKKIAALRWQLRLEDKKGIQVIETNRVVSAGPFRETPGIKEHPSGSFLFELEQTAASKQEDDVEGWNLELNRCQWLAGKIIRSLATNLGENREEVDRIFQTARSHLKKSLLHQEVPHTPGYQGKWLTQPDTKELKNFSGTPKKIHHQKPIASIECFEEISCQICQDACPTSAIRVGRTAREQNKILDESACTSCGLCVMACPSAAITMMKEADQHSTSQVILQNPLNNVLKPGEMVTVTNRRGDTLGSAKVSILGNEILLSHPEETKKKLGEQLLQLELPTHLVWDARGIRPPQASAAEDMEYLAAVERSADHAEKVAIYLQDEKRWVKQGTSLTQALFESGLPREGDTLYCEHGSCGLCQINVDGVDKLACQTTIHQGMRVRFRTAPKASVRPEIEKTQGTGERPPEQTLCPCLEIQQNEILEKLEKGYLNSPEAILSMTPVGSGRCHGQKCMGPFLRLLDENGIDTSQWIDWRFPWTDWKMS